MITERIIGIARSPDTLFIKIHLPYGWQKLTSSIPKTLHLLPQ